MNCEQHETLLIKLLEETISAEEELSLQSHEAACAECAARRRLIGDLQEDLSSLCEEELPLPEDFHAGWMKQVKEAAMEHKPQTEKQTARRPRMHRQIMAWAAALVVLVGGTLLSRDALNVPREAGGANTIQRADSASYQSRSVEESSYDTADSANSGYGMALNSAVTGGTAEADNGSKIIRTASLTLGTERFDEDMAALEQLCQDKSGWISYSSMSGDASRHTRRASLTLRIPAAQYESFLSEAGTVGRVIDQTQTAEDVTASYQDTAARLKTQQAKMERLQALMSDTATLADLLELESAIADTQYTLDSLQAQLNHTDSQVNDTTVDVYLKEETSAEAISVKEKTLMQRLQAGLQTGWQSFYGFVKDMLVFVSAALPYLAVLAVVCTAVVMLRRARKKHNSKKDEE